MNRTARRLLMLLVGLGVAAVVRGVRLERIEGAQLRDERDGSGIRDAVHVRSPRPQTNRPLGSGAG